MGAARPDERDGVSAWRLVDICAHAEEAYGVRCSGWGMSCLLKRLGLSRQKARPAPAGQRGRAGRVRRSVGEARRDRAGASGGAGQLWCQDEARVGQGRTCHRWYERGIRPPGLADRRFDSLCLFAACRPGTDQAFALALPEATTASMGLFLGSASPKSSSPAHAALVLDRAGWHVSRRLAVPGSLTLVPLPPYRPQLNPVRRAWLYLRTSASSRSRVLDGYTAVLDAACRAWNALAAEPGRLASLTAYPYPLRSRNSVSRYRPTSGPGS